MAVTYDYNTCRLERDFKFVRYDECCKLSGLPTYVGRGFCLRCKHNGGRVYSGDMGVEYLGRFEHCYVKCKHPKAKDSDDTGAVKNAYYDFIKYKALCALDG